MSTTLEKVQHAGKATRQGYLGTIATLNMCYHILLSRRSSGVLTLMASYLDFGATLKVDNPGDAWFRRARGPRNQKVAERGYLPSFHHCSIHVVLPSEPWIAVLGSTKALLPTTST